MNGSVSESVVVIGAGIVGVSMAWQLLRRGTNVTLIDRDDPGLGCSFGNAGALSCGSVAPLAMPGVMRDALRMLLDPAAPLRIPLSYLPKAVPWLAQFVRASRPDEVRRIAAALSTLLANSIEKHVEMLGGVGLELRLEIGDRPGEPGVCGDCLHLPLDAGDFWTPVW